MTQIQAFLLTLALEVPCAVFLAGRLGVADLRRIALLAIAGSALTHPLVWWLSSAWTALPPWPRLLLLEAGAVLVEGAVYRIAVTAPRALLLAFVANALSFGVGLLLWAAVAHSNTGTSIHACTAAASP
jgi:hypothetical protein